MEVAAKPKSCREIAWGWLLELHELEAGSRKGRINGQQKGQARVLRARLNAVGITDCEIGSFLWTIGTRERARDKAKDKAKDKQVNCLSNRRFRRHQFLGLS